MRCLIGKPSGRNSGPACERSVKKPAWTGRHLQKELELTRPHTPLGKTGLLPGSQQFPEPGRALGVSTDYLYGLTDDPTPPGETQPQPEGQLTIGRWMPGGVNPSEPGEFAVLGGVGNTRYFKTFMRWDGSSWLMLPSKQQAEFPPDWWLRLPPEPEKGETT